MPSSQREAGSIPLVLLAAIVLAGIIAALFLDVSTGVRLSGADRDFNQAVQIADAGIQDAFIELSKLDKSAFPAIGGDYPKDGPRVETLEGGTFSWTARRSASNSWQVRSVGDFGTAARTLEASVGPDYLFGLAAFGDIQLTLNGGNTAWSYDGTNHSSELVGDLGEGAVGSNENIALGGGTAVDYILHPSDAELKITGGSTIRGDARVVEPQPLPDLGEQAYAPGGVCAGVEVTADIADVLPLEHGRTYCVANATFAAGVPHLLEPETPPAGTPPTRIYIAPSGWLELTGGGSGGCDKSACVNFDPGKWAHPGTQDPSTAQPDAIDLEIYLAGDGVVRLANHAVIAAGIYAPQSACGSSGSAGNAQADIFGSIVCRELINQGGWTFHYDERFGEIDTANYRIRGLREEPGGTTSRMDATS